MNGGRTAARRRVGRVDNVDTLQWSPPMIGGTTPSTASAMVVAETLQWSPP